MAKKKKVPALVKEVKESKIKQKKANLHVSYSQISTWANCPKQWELMYLKKLLPYDPSIHAVFGTAFHETLQTYLDVLYNEKVKDAEALNLKTMLYDNMVKAFKSTKAQNSHQPFSSLEEMNMFYQDGIHILDFITKKRRAYFSTKGTYLAGIETLLYQELAPGVMFKGFIDLVFYNEASDRWTIVDIKTSTSGWSKWAKTDDKKIAQILLYKQFFSKQFNVPIEKIDVEYFIVKRRVPVDAEFAAMTKRVQEFKPAAGTRKTKQAVNLMEAFVDDTIGATGYKDYKPYIATPSKSACKFCSAKRMHLCDKYVM